MPGNANLGQNIKKLVYKKFLFKSVHEVIYSVLWKNNVMFGIAGFVVGNFWEFFGAPGGNFWRIVWGCAWGGRKTCFIQCCRILRGNFRELLGRFVLGVVSIQYCMFKREKVSLVERFRWVISIKSYKVHGSHNVR